MDAFRDDLLDVFFVSNDGAFAFVVSRSEPGSDALVIRAFGKPGGADGAEAPIARDTAECVQTSRASFSKPTDATSSFAPARLGTLSLHPDSDYESAVFMMFGGPPVEGSDSAFAWVALRAAVPLQAVAAFPYYRGSFMDAMTGEDWGDSYDCPSYWYSPQRVYRAAP